MADPRRVPRVVRPSPMTKGVQRKKVESTESPSTARLVATTTDKELARAKAQILELKVSLKESLQQQEKQVECVKQLESEISVKHNLLEQLESSDVAILQAEITQVKQEKKELEDYVSIRVPELEKACDSLKSNSSKIQQENKDLERRVKASTEKTDILEAELAQLKHNIPLLQAKVDRKDAEEEYLAQLNEQNDALDLQVGKAVADCKRKDLRITSLQSDIIALRNELKSLNSQLESSASATGITSSASESPLLFFPVASPALSTSARSMHTLATPILPTAALSRSLKEIASTATDEDSIVMPPELSTVVININPQHIQKRSVLSRLLTTLQPATTIDISGPTDQVYALQKKLRDGQAEYLKLVKDVNRLEDDVSKLQRRDLCVDPSHRDVRDTIDAYRSQIDMCSHLLKRQRFDAQGIEVNDSIRNSVMGN